MAANGIKDADMSESDGEKVVTMMDVLQEQQDFEEDANAVLGASDDKNCTYSKVNPSYDNILIEFRRTKWLANRRTRRHSLTFVVIPTV